MEYKIAWSTTTSGLQETVNAYIQAGFEPIGGITLRFVQYNGTDFYQAMIKRS